MTSAVLTAPGARDSERPRRHHPSSDLPQPAVSALDGHTKHATNAVRRRWWRLALLTVGVVLAIVALRGRLPDAASTWTAVRQARTTWLFAAAVLAVVSMAAFSEQQRHLLAGFGVRMPALVSLALSYARSAMATALPGGSAVSAGYAFRHFRARGASHPVAAAVMLLSGVASVAGLALLYAGAVAAWTSPRTLALIAAITTVAALGAGQRHATRRRNAPTPTASVRLEPANSRTLLARLRRTLRETTTLARSIPTRQWLGVVALAVLNWVTDLACLLAAQHAVGLTVPARTVASAYLATQLVRQIPATPGGIGVIEATLILALTAAGAAQAPAAAAVLIYRVLSCWAMLPIGLLCWTAQKTPRMPPAWTARTAAADDISHQALNGTSNLLLTAEPMLVSMGWEPSRPPQSA
jgi:uncharacterized protein (TIRG00374 family)